MAENKVLKTRIQMKTDHSENWAKATTFVPLKGELIVYNDNDGSAPSIKVGDGTTLLSELPFVTSSGGSFLFQPEEPIAAEEGTIWIDTDEESNTINYVSYNDEQYRTEEQRLNARNNIGAAGINIVTTMSARDYESLSDADFVELYNNGVRILHVENDVTFADKTGVYYIERTLPANGWNENKQVIASSVFKADSSGELTLAKTITKEQVLAASNAMILITGQNEGNIEVTAFGEIPELDIPIVIRVVN